MNQQRLEEVLDHFQEAATEVVSNVVYWIAPVPIAYLVFRSIRVNFDMPTIVALASALAVEVVGMMAFHTMSRIQRTQLSQDVSAQLVWSSRIAVALYIVQVLVFTLFSDVVAGTGRWSILAYVPIAASSYFINGLRRQHNQLVRQTVRTVDRTQHQQLRSEIQLVQGSYNTLMQAFNELSEQVSLTAQPVSLECPYCGRTDFKSPQARGGHIGKCKSKARANGHGS